MPKNKGKGGKNRRRGKNDNDSKRELVYKEDGQEYAQVTKMLGNGRLEAYCFDGVNRLCHIRGKLRKRVWIQQGDIVLIGLREFQDQKADVILKYDNEEARSLKAYGELPENGAPATRAALLALRTHQPHPRPGAPAQCKSTWTSHWTATTSRTTPSTSRRSKRCRCAQLVVSSHG
mmetsp:Transcript_21211/g.71316  ORF Transcript_21211/g.71316 Transcript_21211/m.71316 type:complete len:176 (-) Transcript_21211:1222-1749(-)